MIKLSKLSIISLVFASVTLFTHALPTDSKGNIGNEITLDPNTICFYLPPNPGQIIANEEDDAQPFCNTQSPPGVTGGVNLFPDGFFVSSHYHVGDGFVQYTGIMNPDAYNLQSSDPGGQYDSVGAPPGAQCVGDGFVKFVNLVEPADKRYCIRCCSDESQCDTKDSTKGCPTVIPGDYS